ncbi:unnamed protein product [Coccothraustes coccothraustes]
MTATPRVPRGGGLPAAVNMYQNVNDEPLLNLVKGVTSAERAVGAARSGDRAGPGWAGHGWTGPDHAALTSRVRSSAPRVPSATTATSRSFERREGKKRKKKKKDINKAAQTVPYF